MKDLKKDQICQAKITKSSYQSLVFFTKNPLIIQPVLIPGHQILPFWYMPWHLIQTHNVVCDPPLHPRPPTLLDFQTTLRCAIALIILY